MERGLNSVMEALGFLAGLEARGVEFKTDGGRVFYRPASIVTTEELELIQSRKAELIFLLQARDPALEALCAGLSQADALDLRTERAAILEYEAGLSRVEAETRAGLMTSR
jgi:hypothetical protein